MTLTINKVAAAIVGLAMVAGLALAFTATRAHAITLSELVELFIALEVIPEDKADEARAVLDGQEEEAPAASMSCNFTRDLATGDTGADVMDLQKLLNANGFTVAASGAGSAGMETDYYGPATAGAVAAMQEAFAADILTPLGLTAGTGYFGASTRAKANMLCSDEMPDTPDLPGDDDEDMDDDEDSSDLSGEASLQNFETQSADDDELQEGAEDAEILEFSAEFEDGDALLKRVDIKLEADSGNDEDDPWDVFETISLWLDGDKIAEKNADDKDDYVDDDNGILRLTGLDVVIMEDEEADFEVAATLQGSLDGVDDDEEWEVSVDEIRYEDGDDVTTTDSSTDDIGDDGKVTFTIEEEGSDDELIVKTSSSDPDSAIIKVEDDSKSDWVTIFVFDLDTDDSLNDIVINTLPVTVDTPATSTYNGLVDDARLVIDGETIDSNSSDVTNGGTNSATISFDVDEDVEISAGDRVSAELQLRFLSLAAGDEGATVQGKVTSANTNAIDAEGADDLTNSAPDQLTGSATGDVHQLLTEGIFAEIVSTDAERETNDNGQNDILDFEIKFDVTAFDDTFYVSRTVGSAVTFQVEDDAGNAVTITGATTTVASLSSTADTDGSNAWRVDEGDTETFTLKVTFDPEVVGSYRLQLLTVDFGDDASTPTNQTAHVAAPAEDFETDYETVNQDN